MPGIELAVMYIKGTVDGSVRYGCSLLEEMKDLERSGERPAAVLVGAVGEEISTHGRLGIEDYLRVWIPVLDMPRSGTDLGKGADAPDVSVEGDVVVSDDCA